MNNLIQLSSSASLIAKLRTYFADLSTSEDVVCVAVNNVLKKKNERGCWNFS